MSLTVGSRVGPFEVRAFIGEGGMGRVFRAHDTKLQRDVALKVLPDDFANDSERVSRFHREAQALAALNHPNIAQIHGFEDSTPAKCLVLELVDGEGLDDLLRKGPLPLDETIVIAKQIADALEAAHERGVIHRDLKPANIKINSAGKVKVLDFGLARIFDEQPPSAASLSHSPTMLSPSMPGVILGTPAYMSPEQARGKTVDKRTDVWAFGCILFEMLTGRKLFDGETVSDTIAGILERPLSFDTLPATTPPYLRSLLRRCLKKDARDRLHEIADARIEIEEALNTPSGETARTVSTPVVKKRPYYAAIIIAIVATAFSTAMYFRLSRPLPSEMRLHIATPPGNASFALSPDGTKIVFAATVDGKSQLWLRSLDSDKAEPLAGTEHAILPFWSPDSRSLGFFADLKLKRLDLAGGGVRPLADSGPDGGSWGTGNVILFAPAGTGALRRIPADGGESTEVTTIKPPEQASHRLPQFLPDGNHFLFFSIGNAKDVYLGSLQSKDAKRLFSADSLALFAPPDQILYVRQQTLFAQRFDLNKLEMIGDPAPIAEQIAFGGDVDGQAAISASASLIGYRRTSGVNVQFTWLDKAGTEIMTLGEPDPYIVGGFRLSRNSTMLAFIRLIGGGRDVWVLEIARGLSRPLANEAFQETAPVWSLDGTSVIYSERQNGILDLYQRAVDSGQRTLLIGNGHHKFMEDFSPDGRFAIYVDTDPKTNEDLWVLPKTGDNKRASAIVQTTASESSARFSPDGNWFAYQSNESGKNEVWVQSFPEGRVRKQISIGGGVHPVWGRGGKEIYYLDPGHRLMAVSLDLSSNAASLEVRRPVALFTLPAASDYDFDPIGDRFLINKPLGETQVAPITVVLNWAGGKR